MTTQAEEVGLFIKKENAVEIENVSMSYGFRKKKTEILKGINLTIEKGSIYGLLGPSGCGKTSLLRLIVGRITPDAGSIKIFGHPVGSKENRIPGPGVGYMPQEIALYAEFTITETLTYFGRIFGMSAKDIKHRSTFLLDLLHLSNQSAYIKNLSGGQKRRVSFAVSLFQKAPLLVLDEPTVGVDPLLRLSIWNYLVSLVQEKKIAVLLTTHYIDEVQQANMAGLMRNGTMLAEDSPENLLSRYQCQNLEDVFVKLCYVDDQSSTSVPVNDQNKDANNSFEMTKTSQNPLKNVLNGSLKKHNCIEIKQAKKLISCDCSINSGRLKAVIGLIFQFVIPSIMLSIFCLSLGTKPINLEVGLINNDVSDLELGNRFVESIDTKTMDLRSYDDMSLALQDVEKNRIWALIYIPGNFSSNLWKRFLLTVTASDEILEKSKIRVWLDSIDQQIRYTLQIELLETMQRFAVNVLKEHGINPSVADLPITFENDTIVDDKAVKNYMIFVSPAGIIILAYYMAVALTNLAFVIEKKDGLMDRVYIAGVSNVELVLGFFISQGFVMIVQIALAIIFLIFIFDVPCHGPVFWVLILLFLQGVCGMFQGLLVSAIIDDEYLALFLQFSTFFPCFILSGTVWPIHGMPKLFAAITVFLPQTLPVQAIRAVMLRGWGIEEYIVWRGFAVTLAWMTFFLAATITVLKLRK